jgi:hypothetical protein
VEDFSLGLDNEYLLLVCLSSRASSTNIWYIDIGASLHVTCFHEYITDLIEIGDLDVVFGDDSGVKEVGSGIISFQMESLPPMLLRYFLYVLGLKKNFISVSTIEDRGYEVLFHERNVLLYPKCSNVTSAKFIGI